MRVVIVNYGMGNLGSARRAFEELGADVLVSEDPADLAEADRIVLPGVGSFADGMAHIEASGWPGRLREALESPERALLGICLGMQLLASKGFEGGETVGLNLIPGDVRRFEAGAGERIPHVGWNEVHSKGSDPLLQGIPKGADFYFVHSYRFVPASDEDIVATTPYCGEFASVIGRGNVFGTQFHPEKSSKAGARLLRNFLQLTPG